MQVAAAVRLAQLAQAAVMAVRVTGQLPLCTARAAAVQVILTAVLIVVETVLKV